MQRFASTLVCTRTFPLETVCASDWSWRHSSNPNRSSTPWDWIGVRLARPIVVLSLIEVNQAVLAFARRFQLTCTLRHFCYPAQSSYVRPAFLVRPASYPYPYPINPNIPNSPPSFHLCSERDFKIPSYNFSHQTPVFISALFPLVSLPHLKPTRLLTVHPFDRVQFVSYRTVLDNRFTERPGCTSRRFDLQPFQSDRIYHILVSYAPYTLMQQPSLSQFTIFGQAL